MFYDTNTSGFEGTLITAGQPAGSGSYTWNTTGTPSGTFQVYALVTDSDGIPALAYGDGTATVTYGPIITTNPASQTAIAGNDVTFTAAASGSSPAVQWRVETPGSGTFTAIPGATSTTLDIGDATLAESGNRYEAVFSNSESTATTTAATLTVTNSPISSIAPLQPTTSLTNVALDWSGIPGAGASAITSYTIYVSTDGGPYTAFLTNTPLTSALFIGTDGLTYAFTSQATDNAGNVEPQHSTADATIATTAAPWQNPANPLDVLGQGGPIVPLDALTVINFLNVNPGGVTLLPWHPVGSPYYDVAGMDTVVPLDALDIINYLNSHPTTPTVAPAVTGTPAVPSSPLANAAAVTGMPASAQAVTSGAAVTTEAMAAAIAALETGPAKVEPALSPAVMAVNLGGLNVNTTAAGGTAAPSDAATVLGSNRSNGLATLSTSPMATQGNSLRLSGSDARAVDSLLEDSAVTWTSG